jgi:hypothetical protein
MKNYKNYLIAILAGLLVLSFTTQPSQGAGSSGAAKAIQYDHCLSGYDSGPYGVSIAVQLCKQYQP